MAQYVEIPQQRLQTELLSALLEEYASRDGTDYGEREVPLETKVEQLRSQLILGELCILYESDSEQWDLVPKEQAQQLLLD